MDICLWFSRHRLLNKPGGTSGKEDGGVAVGNGGDCGDGVDGVGGADGGGVVGVSDSVGGGVEIGVRCRHS